MVILEIALENKSRKNSKVQIENKDKKNKKKVNVKTKIKCTTIAELTVPCSLRGKLKSDVYFTVVRISKKDDQKYLGNLNLILRAMQFQFRYRISSYSIYRYYSFLNLEIVANSNNCRNISIFCLIN